MTTATPPADQAASLTTHNGADPASWALGAALKHPSILPVRQQPSLANHAEILLLPHEVCSQNLMLTHEVCGQSTRCKVAAQRVRACRQQPPLPLHSAAAAADGSLLLMDVCGRRVRPHGWLQGRRAQWV